MIRPVKAEDIDKLQPLLELFYIEQQTYIEPFNWEYIKANLLAAVQSPLYLVLTNDRYNCFLLGHISTNLLLPSIEGYEDYIYIAPNARGSSLFLRLLTLWELFCIKNNCKYINIGIGTGINTSRVENLYTKFDYIKYYSGFKKELKACAVEAGDVDKYSVQ